RLPATPWSPPSRPTRRSSDLPGRRRDVRHPFGGGRRRRLASAPPPGGGGRTGDPRPPDRAVDPMSRLTRIDLASLSPTERRRITRRSAVPDPEVRLRAAEICRSVRDGGDAAM